MGDSAGAAIAFHIVARLGEGQLGALAPFSATGASLPNPPILRRRGPHGVGEDDPQPPQSALSILTSDSYWRMAFQTGAIRDHSW
jgi:hypothetical protein